MAATHPIEVDPSNAAALEAWNGSDGDYWVEHEAAFERSLGAYDEPFLDAAGINGGDAVLDIGCGLGGTTRDVARRAGQGAALGIDLSSRMIDRARQRAADAGITNVSFVQGDAQIYPFEPGTFDVAISRTGTMFFGAPIAAFTNIARALRPNGRLDLLVWQPLAANEWVVMWMDALAAGRQLPAPQPDAPGPFSMADPDRVRTILAAAGYRDIALDGLRAPIRFGRHATDAFRFMEGMGFTQLMLRDLDDYLRAGALDALRALVGAHETNDGVVFPSAVWIITAHST